MCSHIGSRVVHMLFRCSAHSMCMATEEEKREKKSPARHRFKTNVIYMFAQMQTFENDSWSQFDRYKLLINNERNRDRGRENSKAKERKNSGWRYALNVHLNRTMCMDFFFWKTFFGICANRIVFDAIYMCVCVCVTLFDCVRFCLLNRSGKNYWLLLICQIWIDASKSTAIVKASNLLVGLQRPTIETKLCPFTYMQNIFNTQIS